MFELFQAMPYGFIVLTEFFQDLFCVKQTTSNTIEF